MTCIRLKFYFLVRRKEQAIEHSVVQKYIEAFSTKIKSSIHQVGTVAPLLKVCSPTGPETFVPDGNSWEDSNLF